MPAPLRVPSGTSSKPWFDKLKLISSTLGLPEDPTHPLQIALRTYALSISLSLGPSLVSLITSTVYPSNNVSRNVTNRSGRLREAITRELALDGFAFAITTAVGGGAALQHLWGTLDEWYLNASSRSKPQVKTRPTGAFSVMLMKLTSVISRSLPTYQKTFISNMISSSLAITLLQAGRHQSNRFRQSSAGSTHRPSLTLDLTLLLLVRAVDALVQCFVFKRSDMARTSGGIGKLNMKADILKETLDEEKWKRELAGKRQRITTQIDAFVFWSCSARIMWCFFYEPQRLPRSYVTWIRTLANVDGRLIKALQAIRAKKWSYMTGSATHSYLLMTLAENLGYPASWGDPVILPAYGGHTANAIWKTIGVNGRHNIGGLPCEIVHGGVGSRIGLGDSCMANASLRFSQAFLEAIAIYLPAHILPILLTRPQAILRPRHILSTVLAALRSATFLSSFVSTYWFSICLTRTLLFARLFPWIPHDFWDGPYGCVLVGCMMCGSSIWIENGRRRGEMALYVLPRAVRAWLPDAWVRSRNPGVRAVERFTFVLSLAYLLTAAAHSPESLRGLSRWTLAFITKGPSAGFWKQKRQDPTPRVPHIPTYTPEPAIPSTATFKSN